MYYRTFLKDMKIINSHVRVIGLKRSKASYLKSDTFSFKKTAIAAVRHHTGLQFFSGYFSNFP